MPYEYFALKRYLKQRLDRDYSSSHRREEYEEQAEEEREEFVEERRYQTYSSRQGEIDSQGRIQYYSGQDSKQQQGYNSSSRQAEQRSYSASKEYGGGNSLERQRHEEYRGQQQQYTPYIDAYGTGGRMAVDYSAQDFHRSFAAIDAASRADDGIASRMGDGVRVRHQGDTTVVTEHRDPYSFYWQLDQARRESVTPPRRPPPTDYVIDEEEIVDTVLSPESGDSGIVFENQYSRPQRVQSLPPPLPPVEDEPKLLPPGWEKHQDPSGYSYYWHVDSGTIQRDPPRAITPPRSPSPPPAPVYSRTIPSQSREVQVDAPPPPPQIIQLPPQQPVIEEHAFKQTTTKRRIENDQESDGEQEVQLNQQQQQSEFGYSKVRTLSLSVRFKCVNV